MVVGRVHHVGHVVHDMDAALALYRRMGFTVPPPAFPVLPATVGERPRVLGAGNTHVSLRHGFVELLTVLNGREPGPDATLVPLEVPAAAVARVVGGIEATTARVAAAAARFEGMHILVLETSDADAAAARLTADGIAHGGVLRLRRPGNGGEGIPIGLVEIDGADGRTPEGRLALAEGLSEPVPDHSNGAIDLVGPVLCVADGELVDYEQRYERLLGRPARADGPARVFDLDPLDRYRAGVVLVAQGALAAVLPGERAPALPAFVGFTVRVSDLAATRDLLVAAGFPVCATPAGAVFVPAIAAMGCAVIFRD